MIVLIAGRRCPSVDMVRVGALSVNRSDDLEEARRLIASRKPVEKEALAARP